MQSLAVLSATTWGLAAIPERRQVQLGGGAVGAAAGSMVNDKTLVEGVSLTYKEGTKVYTSTQVGKECQFTTGLAVVITTTYNETRIQPNTKCPEKS